MNSQTRLLLKTPLYWAFRFAGRPRVLPFSYTYSVTYRCNSKCKTCNIWKIQHRVPKDQELSLQEWTRVIRSIGSAPFWVTISGGEPFLRTDLPEIVRQVFQHNRPKILNIPTDCLLPKRISQYARVMLGHLPEKSTLVINLSVDDIEDRHDEIRGIPGNWGKCMDVLIQLRDLKTSHPNGKNLVIGIHTVISKFNVERIPIIAHHILNRLSPDQYITEIAEERGEMENFEDSPTPEAGKYGEAIGFLISTIGRELKRGRWRGLAKTTESFRLLYYEYVRDLYLKKHKGMTSYAGFASCQISPTGEVWECAVSASKMGNLRDVDYSFRRLWTSRQAQAVRKKVKAGHPCPLANEAYTNILLNPRYVARVAKGLL